MAKVKAVLFKSNERFDSFQRKLEEYNIQYDILDFNDREWLNYDFSDRDFIIYYPIFEFSSNYHLSLYQVHDNLVFLKSVYPDLRIFPDPDAIWYYNDKYRQYLFLNHNKYPIPQTIPLTSEKSMLSAHRELGYPMIIKNRYGAGGGAVFKINSFQELQSYFKLSMLNFFNRASLKYYLGMALQRIFFYNLIKVKKIAYPFLSPPLLAQKFVKVDRDLRIVVGEGRVIEAHWRIQAHETQWKVNIDAGGIGEWSNIPQSAISLAEDIAEKLKARWIAFDMLYNGEDFLITEFSPVWHHYAYKEKPSFVYSDDYNIEIPLEISLDLERMIIESLIPK